MRLSCYWSWFSSSHCQSSCGSTKRYPSGSADYFDNVMTRFMINNRTDTLKTDINLFFTMTNCRMAGSRSSTRRMNFKFVPVRILTIKIGQWALVNFCSYRKIIFPLPGDLSARRTWLVVFRRLKCILKRILKQTAAARVRRCLDNRPMVTCFVQTCSQRNDSYRKTCWLQDSAASEFLFTP